jgi:REP element-mobilizing transposase RayT
MEDWRDFKRWHPRAKLSDFTKQCKKGENIVDIVAYCLNPNHFHLLLKQKKENGIKNYMHKVSTSHTNYFNVKHDRGGSLFQGPFKSSHIKSTGKLLYMSVYVSCNSEVHGIAKAKNYRWCSFPEYLGKKNNHLCNKKVILDQFKGVKDYLEFAKENVKAQRQKKDDEKILLES